jgi:hypothetical protein
MMRLSAETVNARDIRKEDFLIKTPFGLKGGIRSADAVGFAYFSCIEFNSISIDGGGERNH